MAIAALRAPNLVQVQPDPQLVVLGMLADRRDELGRARTQVVNRLLLELDAALEGSMSSPIMIDWLGLPCQDSMAQAPWCSLAAEFTMSAG